MKSPFPGMDPYGNSTGPEKGTAAVPQGPLGAAHPGLLGNAGSARGKMSR
jgi:hypothetical protein